jgi:hypothetical protein
VAADIDPLRSTTSMAMAIYTPCPFPCTSPPASAAAAAFLRRQRWTAEASTITAHSASSAAHTMIPMIRPLDALLGEAGAAEAGAVEAEAVEQRQTCACCQLLAVPSYVVDLEPQGLCCSAASRCLLCCRYWTFVALHGGATVAVRAAG